MRMSVLYLVAKVKLVDEAFVKAIACRCVVYILSYLFVLALTTRQNNLFGDEDQIDFLRTLRAGVDRQLRDVEFKCTYTYSSYVVDTLEEAENFDISKGRLVIHATGILAKTNKMTFESFALDTLDTKIPEFYMDHITVTNPELRANYRKQSLQFPYRTLFVFERQEENKDLPILEGRFANITCPLNITGSRIKPNFLDVILSEHDEYGELLDVSVKEDKDFTVIYLHHDEPDVEAFDTTYAISSKYPYPVLVEERASRIRRIGGQLDNISYSTRASDFVRLNDGCVLPKKVYTFRRIVFDDFRETDVGKWLVSKWESEDMGKEKPKKSDFYIYLDRNSDIGGLALNLNYKINRELPEYFDINKYSIRDLQTSSPIESQVDRGSDFSVWIRPAILLIAGLCIACGIWKKWKNAKGGASA